MVELFLLYVLVTGSPLAIFITLFLIVQANKEAQYQPPPVQKHKYDPFYNYDRRDRWW